MNNKKILMALFSIMVFGIVVKVATSMISSAKSPACVRQSWASTDPCKNLAVATKDAPKDTKTEIERLASLTVTTFELTKLEDAESEKKYQSEVQQWKIDTADRKEKIIEIQSACFKSLGIKFDPTSYLVSMPSKCAALFTKYPSSPQQPYRTQGGPASQAWAQAWLDLSTLAKTFPQYIQPSSLSLLVNSYEKAKTCVSNPNCLPEGL
jgi:hypothetical protein